MACLARAEVRAMCGEVGSSGHVNVQTTVLVLCCLFVLASEIPCPIGIGHQQVPVRRACAGRQLGLKSYEVRADHEREQEGAENSQLVPVASAARVSVSGGAIAIAPRSAPARQAPRRRCPAVPTTAARLCCTSCSGRHLREAPAPPHRRGLARANSSGIAAGLLY